MIIKRKHKIENNNEDLQQSKSDGIETEDDSYAIFNIDEIKFEQRSERRQGSRRRGYRRIDDRNLISRAQEEAISIKESAAKEGHKSGLEMAKQDINKLMTAIEEFFAFKDEIYEELTNGILDISVEVAKKIIKTELKTNKKALLNIINEVINTNTKGENRITVKVMPGDVEEVKNSIPEILSNTQFEAKIIVVPDSKIELGGAIIETSNGVVDATIETQIKIIEEAFKKG